MNHFTSRAYGGASDLNLLIEFAERAAKARWPRSTYKKVGDVVWTMPGFDPSANIRLWFDGTELVAYVPYQLKERSVHRLGHPECDASRVREAHFLGIDRRMQCL